MIQKPKLLIFASGTPEEGGSGFENLVRAAATGKLGAEIVGVVSNHPTGGVSKRALRLRVPFLHFPAPFTAPRCQEIVGVSEPHYVALSGWNKLVLGLDPKTTFNIHPAPLPRFGGKGMHGIHVHEAVLDAYRKGEIKHSAVTMHFVTEEYDGGPVFFRLPIEIRPEDTPKTLQNRVKNAEHFYQPFVTDLVVRGNIRWDGKNPDTLERPPLSGKTLEISARPTNSAGNW